MKSSGFRSRKRIIKNRYKKRPKIRKDNQKLSNHISKSKEIVIKARGTTTRGLYAKLSKKFNINDVKNAEGMLKEKRQKNTKKLDKRTKLYKDTAKLKSLIKMKSPNNIIPQKDMIKYIEGELKGYLTAISKFKTPEGDIVMNPEPPAWHQCGGCTDFPRQGVCLFGYCCEGSASYDFSSGKVSSWSVSCGKDVRRPAAR